MKNPHLPVTAWLVLLILATACSANSGQGGSDASPSLPDADPYRPDADTTACTMVESVCPPEGEARPFPGGVCQEALECVYNDADGDIVWTYTCVDGHWEADCQTELPGACGVAMAEYCQDPFAATAPGAAVAIGPVSFTEPFRPFEPSDVVTAVWGPQGIPMVPFRVQTSGADGIDCVDLAVDLTVGDTPTGEQPMYVKLRCGESLTVYSMIFEDICGQATYEASLKVDLQGLGTTTGSFVLDGNCATGGQ